MIQKNIKNLIILKQFEIDVQFRDISPFNVN